VLVDRTEHESAKEGNTEPESRARGSRTQAAVPLRQQVIEDPALQCEGREAKESKDGHFE
jgi:hypothetical protein